MTKPGAKRFSSGRLLAGLIVMCLAHPGAAQVQDVQGNPGLTAANYQFFEMADPAGDLGLPRFDSSRTWHTINPNLDRQMCHDPTGAGQIQTNACHFRLEKLPLNARAIAWLHFQDEAISGRYYCIPDPIPSLLVFPTNVARFHQRNDHVKIEYVTSTANIERIIWTDGRPFPPPSEVFYYGFSVGHYEGDELVVETRNFTFDPNGIALGGQLPSSWLKRITERYSVTGEDEMQMVLTIEDPVFMKELQHRLLVEHPGYYGGLVWIVAMLETWLQDHA